MDKIIVLKNLVKSIENRNANVECIGVSGSEKGLIISDICQMLNVPVVVVLPTSKDAEKFISDFTFFSPKNKKSHLISNEIAYFRPQNISTVKSLSYHNEVISQRIRILYELSEGLEIPLIVTTVPAVIQKILPKNELNSFAELIMEGEEINRDNLISKLVAGGYTRSTIVEDPGDFSVRGGIIDIFSPLYDEPLRIDLFGEVVESLRFFSPLTQMKTKSISEAVIVPAKEIILKKEQLNKIISRIREQAFKLDISVIKVREIIERIKDEGVFPGIENFLSIVYPKLNTFFDYIPPSTLFILSDYSEFSKTAKMSWTQLEKNYFFTVREKRFCVSPENLLITWRKLNNIFKKNNPLIFKDIPILTKKKSVIPDNIDNQDNNIIDIDIDNQDNNPDKIQSCEDFNIKFSIENNLTIKSELKNIDHNNENILLPLINWINDKKDKGYNVVLVSGTRSRMERLLSLLAPYGIEPELLDKFNNVFNKKTSICSCIGHISSGFVWQEMLLAVITEDEILGKRRMRRTAPAKKKGRALLSFQDLNRGDIVVHQEHGLGRYEGLTKLSFGKINCDFLLVTYKSNDKLYIPIDQMNRIQKYMGVDGFTPALDKMGGKSWQKVKDKAKKEVEKIAGELLELYAQRKVNKGHAFSQAGNWFSEFETTFPFEETPDQLKAINAVIDDMEQPVPMDRLVCGDVGYGKTEVAIRASFMAVNDGKQVAILVPTTVLAEQHAKLFSERFKKYSINVAGLSRFRTKKEQAKIIDNLACGKVDILIGTHRIVQKDIKFKDIGLIVVDEEQRFGVKHKEKLKKFRSTVDVLTLTATPIPRTLHLSLTGMRDISVISTPPKERQAIITYISEFDDTVITDAIRRELKRGGQIYFVHNHVGGIFKIAAHLQKLVPEVRLGVAHGQLNEHKLEEEMMNFIDKKIDMLVCTTIIESGLDIPAANTMLINKADRFGLAQMYQLRGRIGRGAEQAYAYLFIPEENTLGKNAQKRLKVLMEHSDLGSGFQIAMSDLQIRGGGSALGASQSGHIAAVGYDIFLRLMDNAIADIKGEPVVEKLEPEINIGLSTFIPESYISEIDQRLVIYRRLAKMSSLNEIADLKHELEDRFGKLPEEGANVLLKIMLKILSINAGVKKLDLNYHLDNPFDNNLNNQEMFLAFSEIHQKNPLGIVKIVSNEENRFNFTKDNILRAKLSGKSLNAVMVSAKNVLKDIALYVG